MLLLLRRRRRRHHRLYRDGHDDVCFWKSVDIFSHPKPLRAATSHMEKQIENQNTSCSAPAGGGMTTMERRPASTTTPATTTPATTTTRICSRCTCLASCAWHKSKTQPNASLCETCYRVEALELVDKKCHSCETTKTSRQWYKSKITVGDLCKRCYRIELVALQHKTCIACSSKTTSGHWYKSKLLPDGDLCNNCYGKVSARLFIFISDVHFSPCWHSLASPP